MNKSKSTGKALQCKTVTRRNLVAKHARTYNLSHQHVDKKAALKRGKVKHKGQGADLIDRLTRFINSVSWT